MIQWLFDNPLLLILLGGWLLSMLGNVMAKAAKRAAREQERRRADPRSAPGGQQQQPQVHGRPAPGRQAQTPPPQSPQRSTGPDPQEIAAEIRRIMGLEGPAPKPEPPPPPPGPVPEPAPKRAAPRRTLAEEMSERDRHEVHLGSLQDRKSDVGQRIESRHLGHLKTALTDTVSPQPRVTRARPKAGRKRYLDLSRPASAIVAREVLGKPLGLRDLE